MMKHMVTGWLMFCLFSPPIYGQQGGSHLNEETEIGTDGSGHFFSSQYAFYAYHKERKIVGLSMLVHYFKVSNEVKENRVKRIEWGLGPDVNFRRVSLHSYIGRTTDSRVFAAAVGVVFLPADFIFVGIFDAKFPFGSKRGEPKTWFRKVSLSRGRFAFRWEDFQIERCGTAFGRVGGEIRIHPRKKVELFSNPFYDYHAGKIGIQSGVRIGFF